MAIQTIYREQHGDLSLARVRVTDGIDRRESWEVSCDRCDEICTNLTRAEADAEIAEHVCREAVR